MGKELAITGRGFPLCLKNKSSGRTIDLKGKFFIPSNSKELVDLFRFVLNCNDFQLNLKKIFPDMEDLSLNGSLSLDVAGGFKKGNNFAGFAKLALSDVGINKESENFSIEGVNADFEINDFNILRSPPAQKLTFSILKYGTMIFKNGGFDFQLESNKSLFLEKSTIEWCDGQIDMGALRINLDKPEDLTFSIYCDRIEIAELLKQLNVAHAAGGGLVAGRIPVNFRNGKLNINNGFLYSTPGVGGRIQLIDFSDTALADTSLQLALSREALKDYNYKWIRLTFNSEQEFMNIKLSLDGAPNRKLPFRLNKNGVLMFDQHAMATFLGIAFDIRFMIPMNHLIKLGRKVGGLL